MGYCLGIDGCRGGWVAAILGEKLSIKYFKTLEEMRELIENSDFTLIDMPMGLPSDGTSDRLCDKEARTYLKKRKMSIFPIPSRQAIYSNSYEESSFINKRVTGKGLSKQAYNLFPKIKEVDTFIRKDTSILSKICEGHPELSFARIYGKDMTYSKKTIEGIEERFLLLETFLSSVRRVVEEFLVEYPKKTIVTDDVLDATSLALSIEIAKARGCSYIPKKEIRDIFGINMRIFLLK